MEVGAGWKLDICHFQQGVASIKFHMNKWMKYVFSFVDKLKVALRARDTDPEPDVNVISSSACGWWVPQPGEGL